jgi:hypothetical protein
VAREVKPAVDVPRYRATFHRRIQERSYFKLTPHFRYVAMTGSGDVAAQIGVEFRVIRVGEAVLRRTG